MTNNYNPEPVKILKYPLPLINGAFTLRLPLVIYNAAVAEYVFHSKRTERNERNAKWRLKSEGLTIWGGEPDRSGNNARD